MYSGRRMVGNMASDTRIYQPTYVSSEARIGGGSEIYRFTVIREGVSLGKRCSVRNHVYIDRGVQIGNDVKIMDGALIYRGVTLEDEVFIGPGVIFTNDKNPRSRKTSRDLTNVAWRVKTGASIGAGSIIAPDVTIGRYALIGSGSLVTKDIPDHALAYGSPACVKGFVCEQAHILQPKDGTHINDCLEAKVIFSCNECGGKVAIPMQLYAQNTKGGGLGER